jgi:hypothetical protein
LASGRAAAGRWSSGYESRLTVASPRSGRRLVIAAAVTPGSARTRVNASSKNRSCSAAVMNADGGSATSTVRMPAVSNPLSTCIRRAKLTTSSPVVTRSAAPIAACAPTRTRRARPPRGPSVAV